MERIRAFLKEGDAKGYTSSSKSSTATPMAYYDHSYAIFVLFIRKLKDSISSSASLNIKWLDILFLWQTL
jgi:hypothetical protein